MIIINPLVSPLEMRILFLSLDGRGKVRVRLFPFSDARKRELLSIFSNCAGAVSGLGASSRGRCTYLGYIASINSGEQV
jgi:hypothetical protein